MGDEDTLHPGAEQLRRPEGVPLAAAPLAAPVPAGSPSSAARPKIAGYEILGELGRGGMGVVYKARHIGLNRIVALKMILSAEHAGRQAVARFRVEAEAVAQLRHPNIVQVYDIGEQDGRPYFSMEFVEGGSLAKRIDGQPQPPSWCAAVCAKLALAMHSAHSQGIVHRDLKPANVLLSTPLVPAGRRAGVRGPITRILSLDDPMAPGLEPKIMDFGMAKRLEGGTPLTHSGAMMGTPQYMAPEQASGETKRVGPPADVYALGAILYTMLTGKPPFSAGTAMEVLRKVLGEEPTPPTMLHKRIPPDLETICLKCLQKEPAKRYPNANELAADLRRFLNHEPIVARPAGLWERAAKWAKRRPAAAALIGVSALALLALAGGGLWYNAQLVAERNKAVAEAQRAGALEQKQRLEAERARGAEAQATRRLADSLVLQADALCQAGRPRESLDLYNEARGALTSLGEPTLAVETGLFELCSAYPAPLNTFSGHTNFVSSVAFSPDGKLALSGSDDNTLKLWNLAMGRELRTFSGHSGTVLGVAFSPDGKLALSGSYDKTLKLWDVVRGRELRTFSGHTNTVTSVAFSPEGKLAISGSYDSTLKLWEVATGHELRTLSGHTHFITSVAFSPDGKLALSASNDKRLRLWDVTTGRELQTFNGHTHFVTSVAFSPDGKLALSGSQDCTVKLWDMATGRELRTFSGHNSYVQSVAFSPDGKLVLSGSWDKTLKLWDVATGRELRTFSGHIGPVSSVAFSPDGNLALSGGEKTLELWDMAAGRELRTFSSHTDGVLSVALSPDGKLALSGSRALLPSIGAVDNTLKLWDVATGRELRTFSGHTANVWAVAFSPDGKLALSGSDNRTLRLWDVATGRELWLSGNHTYSVQSVAFSPNGTLALSGSQDKTLKLWDVATGRDIRTFRGHTSAVWGVAFSPAGNVALSGSRDKTLKLWDVATGRELRTFSGHTEGVLSVAFSPEGKLALSGSEDKTLKLWDVATGRELRTFSGHTGPVSSVAFSADGNLALSGSGGLPYVVGGDKTLKLWDVATGRELRTLRGHSKDVGNVEFSPDGMKIISASSELHFRDFTRPARYREFDTLLPKAREAIQKNENDAEALKTLGEWYAFRGVNRWAVEVLEKARKNGANLSPLTLARCYWLLSEDTHEPKDMRHARRAAAAAEFQKELARVKAQPGLQDAKAKGARKQEELYLDLCLQALLKPVAGDK